MTGDRTLFIIIQANEAGLVTQIFILDVKGIVHKKPKPKWCYEKNDSKWYKIAKVTYLENNLPVNAMLFILKHMCPEMFQ